MTQIKLAIMAILAIAFLSIGGVAMFYRAEAASAAREAAQAISDRDTAIAANKAQEATIGRLRVEAARNDKLTAELEQKLAEAKVAVLKRKDDLTELKETDATTFDYLKAPVPLSLRRLYDN